MPPRRQRRALPPSPRQMTCNPHLLSATSGRLTACSQCELYVIRLGVRGRSLIPALCLRPLVSLYCRNNNAPGAARRAAFPFAGLHRVTPMPRSTNRGCNRTVRNAAVFAINALPVFSCFLFFVFATAGRQPLCSRN